MGKPLAENEMRNAITHKNTMRWPLYTTKKASGDRLQERKAPLHSPPPQQLLLTLLPYPHHPWHNKTAYTMAIQSPKKNPQVPNFVLKDFANASQGNPGSGADDFAEFDKFLKIFEKSMPLIDELDTLLARYKVPTERTKILADTTIQSLLSPNPFKFIKDTIRLHRTEFGFEKAAGSIAVSENISTQQAKIKLKALG